MPPMHVRDGGTWKQVLNTGLSVRDAGTWKSVSEGYVRDGSVWKQFHQTSDPQTYTWNANWSQSYSGAVSNSSTNRDKLMYEGFSSIHGNEGALIGFDDANIRSLLAVRPTIISIRIRLESRWSFDGGGKTFHICTHNHATKPGTASFGATQATQHFARGANAWVSLPIAVGNSFRNGTVKGMGLRYNSASNAWGFMAGMYTTTTLTATPTSAQIVASGTSVIPRLEITCDF